MEDNKDFQEDQQKRNCVPEVVEDGGNVLLNFTRVHQLLVHPIQVPEHDYHKLEGKKVKRDVRGQVVAILTRQANLI